MPVPNVVLSVVVSPSPRRVGVSRRVDLTELPQFCELPDAVESDFDRVGATKMLNFRYARTPHSRSR